MGDRANIVMTYGPDLPAVYLYTHWDGTELPTTLQRALSSDAGRERWNDESYLARIIFCEMVRGEERSATGYGIAPYPSDNEHDWLIVDARDGIVERRKYDWQKSDAAPSECELLGRWTFEEYCALDAATLEAIA